MPTKSMGKDPNMNVTIIDLALRKDTTPPEGWDGATEGNCPLCESDVWMPATINEVMQTPGKTMLCSTCAASERHRLSKL